MRAELLLRSKDVLSDGAIVEMVLWLLPEPVPGCTHSYKYCRFYGRDGKRIAGFDNERPKGNHCHLDGIERLYRFTDVDKLIEDFMREMNDRRELK